MHLWLQKEKSLKLLVEDDGELRSEFGWMISSRYKCIYVSFRPLLHLVIYLYIIYIYLFQYIYIYLDIPDDQLVRLIFRYIWLICMVLVGRYTILIECLGSKVGVFQSTSWKMTIG